MKKFLPRLSTGLIFLCWWSATSNVSRFQCFAFDTRARRFLNFKQQPSSLDRLSSLRDSTSKLESPEPPERRFGTYSARELDDNGLRLTTDDLGRLTARPPQALNDTTSIAVESSSSNTAPKKRTFPRTVPQQEQPQQKRRRTIMKEQSPQVVPTAGFNVVLTHCTADFDSLASAVGLARLWSSTHSSDDDFDSESDVPTFVVLPRGAHPGVQRFLALHKHLFPIRSLRSLPSDLSNLNRLGLVDAQRRDRIGPAENLLSFAKRITVVDHHIDSESDIPEATDYVVDQVGSVSTLIVERIQQANLVLTEAEATLMALGIHADTGSLCFDSTTTRDAKALAWTMEQGASQAAIAEHATVSLSNEQQGVLTQALVNANATTVHGVTISTVLLEADGFINGLATVCEDALELSSGDVFLLALVYEARSGGSRRSKRKKTPSTRVESRLLAVNPDEQPVMTTKAWKDKEQDEAALRQRLKAAFDWRDTDNSGYLDPKEFTSALMTSGVVVSDAAINQVIESIDTNKDGKIDFEEFVVYAKDVEERQKQQAALTGKKPSTMIIIGRVRAGVNMKAVKLNRLLEKFGGGGHSKAASATLRLNDESEAVGVLQDLVDELIETSLQKQPTVGDFMTAPVLSVKPDMTEKQVEDLFTRYDVRALPVVDDKNDVIGLVTYKEVAAAKQRLWNKEQKRLREVRKAKEGKSKHNVNNTVARDRKGGTTVKGWMKQHIQTVEANLTMAEAEAVLLENDVGCIPVVEAGTKQLVGMVTRTDLLRQHRYYPSLHYHNKGFSDSIAARKPIIELRKRLKKFDIEDE